MEPRVLSLCWIPRGHLAVKPDRIQNDDEIEALARAAENERLEEISSEEEEDEDEEENNEEKSEEPEVTQKEEENDPVAELNALGFDMDSYDQETNDVTANIGSLIVPKGENEYDFGDEEDQEEIEDVTLGPDDHVLLAGNDCPDGTANVEVRIFNLNDEFYVRNDIPLSSPPLCLAYVKAEIGQVVEEASNGAKVEYSSNFVAIGCLGGLIQIWDLDVLDAPGPAYSLRGHTQESMVISLDSKADKLASGGSDGRLLVWSLTDGSKVQLGAKSDSPINQAVFFDHSKLCSGDAKGQFNIYIKEKDTWKRWRSMKTGSEIEKIAVSESLIAIGGANGSIRLLDSQSARVLAHWSAHLSEPITGLQFNTNKYLFSAGHEIGAALVQWDLRNVVLASENHQEPGSESKRPRVRFTRARQKAAGKLFCAVACPERGSELVLTGGESGGAQVVKLSKQSKNKKEDSDDDDSEDENEDDEKVKEIEEEEWETDTGSSEGEEMDE